ncbi:MAG: phosphoribosylanthranilate isomerase [Caldilineaceae bacterium SB0661_bin_32]|uniref:N-(5'-phosphoribosyl)anthranilate isomerase n=1 Tax=Caldilineaceae bacterium SB0661_bin_32 TaxID=2605255 RepID=A0A6B1D756_9CHLR|nr:phosphoribosylanthranilate isomerase [Caldilineaceae bacterium SB0661_bin_32]
MPAALERDRKTIGEESGEGGAREMTVLKLCGTTSAGDAQLARGADFCGMLVGVDWSERSLTLEQAKRVAEASSVKNVILLCNPSAAFAEKVAKALRPHALQLHCRERPALVSELKELLPCEIWKTVHLPLLDGQAAPEAFAEAGADALLVDSVDVSEGFERLGGTGKVGDWAAVAALKEKIDTPLFLAGGIGPENVADAVRSVRPHGIDLCSGVEMRRGRRDPEKVKKLVRRFREAVAEISEMPGQEEE